jgi:hypothetical protein
MRVIERINVPDILSSSEIARTFVLPSRGTLPPSPFTQPISDFVGFEFFCEDPQWVIWHTCRNLL